MEIYIGQKEKRNPTRPCRTPTPEELREFFKANDWSVATVKEYDYDNLTADERDELEAMDISKPRWMWLCKINKKSLQDKCKKCV